MDLSIMSESPPLPSVPTFSCQSPVFQVHEGPKGHPPPSQPLRTQWRKMVLPCAKGVCPCVFLKDVSVSAGTALEQ